MPFGSQAKCLIEWRKFTGHAPWSVAGENESQPLDTHHPDHETVQNRKGRDACATLRSGHRCFIGMGFTQTAVPLLQGSRFPAATAQTGRTSASRLTAYSSRQQTAASQPGIPPPSSVQRTGIVA